MTRDRELLTRRKLIASTAGLCIAGAVALFGAARERLPTHEANGRATAAGTQSSSAGTTTGSSAADSGNGTGAGPDGASGTDTPGHHDSRAETTGSHTPGSRERDDGETPAADDGTAATSDPRDTLSVTLDPESRTITGGEETTYDVVVTGATDGISGYNLTVTLTDPSVASFTRFEHNFDPPAHDETVTDTEVSASAGLSKAISGIGEVELGTLTVVGDGGGQTDIRIRDTAADLRVISADTSDILYGVTETHDGELTVVTDSGSPTATHARYSVGENKMLVVSSPGVLANDTAGASGDDDLKASVVSGPAHGELTLRSDGSFQYTPESGFTGEDTFTYEVRDQHGRTDTATVSITVTE